MELGVYGSSDGKKRSISIPLNNPYKPDIKGIVAQARGFAITCGANVDKLDIAGLVPRMIEGVAGCERGCPKNAQRFVESGFPGVELDYVEGGILTAKVVGTELSIKLFPDF